MKKIIILIIGLNKKSYKNLFFNYMQYTNSETNSLFVYIYSGYVLKCKNQSTLNT
jgi:hypothetical protein